MEFFSKSRLEKAQAALGELAKLENAELAKIQALGKELADLEAAALSDDEEAADLSLLRAALVDRSKRIAKLREQLDESQKLLPVLGRQRIRALQDVYRAEHDEARKNLPDLRKKAIDAKKAVDKAAQALRTAEQALRKAEGDVSMIERRDLREVEGNYTLAAIVAMIDDPRCPVADRGYIHHCERRGLHRDYTFQVDAAGRIENPAPETAFND